MHQAAWSCLTPSVGKATEMWVQFGQWVGGGAGRVSGEVRGGGLIVKVALIWKTLKFKKRDSLGYRETRSPATRRRQRKEERWGVQNSDVKPPPPTTPSGSSIVALVGQWEKRNFDLGRTVSQHPLWACAVKRNEKIPASAGRLNLFPWVQLRLFDEVAFISGREERWRALWTVRPWCDTRRLLTFRASSLSRRVTSLPSCATALPVETLIVPGAIPEWLSRHVRDNRFDEKKGKKKEDRTQRNRIRVAWGKKNLPIIHKWVNIISLFFLLFPYIVFCFPYKKRQ